MMDNMLDRCQWFFTCKGESVGVVWHHSLGWVEVCQNCLDFLGETPSPTQYIPPLVAASLRKRLGRADSGT